MKKLIIIVFAVFVTQSYSQGGSEIQLYQSVTPNLERTRIKILSTYDHTLGGVTHIGLDLEKLKLGSHQAIGLSIQFGHTFDNFTIPIEMSPILSVGWMFYDDTSSLRLNLGGDLAYVLNNTCKLHLLITTAKENWHENPTQDKRERVYVASIGISFKL